MPDRLDDQEMYKQALELVQSVTTGPTHQALENLDKKVGSGNASLDLQAIVKAASSGRVEQLFLLKKDSADASQANPDSIDTALAQTLQHGGEVTVLPETTMPAGGEVCAVFRYAAPGGF